MIGVDTSSALKHGTVSLILPLYTYGVRRPNFYPNHTIWLHGSRIRTIYEDKYKYFIR